MQISPLRLDRLAFQKVQLEAGSKPQIPTDFKVDSVVNLYQNQENPARWKVDLTVIISGEHAPYIGEITAFGEYTVKGDLPEDAVLNLVNVNGPTMLYSAIREMVLNISARGINPPLLLPSVNFIDRMVKKTPRISESKEAAEAEARPPSGAE